MLRDGVPASGDSPAPASVEPARMTHVAVRTRDVDASVDFYCRYAGLRQVHERVDGEVRVVWLSDRPEPCEFAVVILELGHGAPGDPSPMDHFGFAVSSRQRVDEIAALAEREGRLQLGPLDAGPIVGYIALVRDPSGNRCEFSHGQALQPSVLEEGRAGARS